jgi:cell division protein FtsL
MTRLNFALLVLLVVSGLYLVRVSYDARRVFTELDRARSAERKLNTEFDRLELERRGAAATLRVEKLAKDRLGMRAATPNVTEYVPHAPPVVAASGAAP